MGQVSSSAKIKPELVLLRKYMSYKFIYATYAYLNDQYAFFFSLSYWGVKFTLADHVHMLSDDRTFVEMANANGSSLVKEKINEYEKQFDFTLMCQWTDNYIVDMAANDELWEGLIASGRKLMESNDANNYSIWRDFPCEEWERQRVYLKSVFKCIQLYLIVHNT